MAVSGYTKVVSEQEWLAIREHLGLSPRQAEIIKHILQGASDKEIAEEMEISVPTVRTYMNRLFRKFDLNDRVKLVLHVVACARGYGPQHENRDEDGDQQEST